MKKHLIQTEKYMKRLYFLLLSIAIYTSTYGQQNTKSSEVKAHTEIFTNSKNTNKIERIMCWGNSITDGGEAWQNVLRDFFQLNVINCGRSSDWSEHIRRRFVSYFTDGTPYLGNSDVYAVKPSSYPSLAIRKSYLKNSFFIFWIGTNNLINTEGRKVKKWATGNTSFNKHCPKYNEKVDVMFANSYADQMVKDINAMVSLIPNGNFVILTGHGAFDSSSEKYRLMKKADEMIEKMYPLNFLNIKEALTSVTDDYSTISADFMKPEINASTTITLSNASWVNGPINSSRKICIGTKDCYDIYSVTAVSGNKVTATLIYSNTPFEANDTIPANYELVSDLGRSSVTMQISAIPYEDIVRYNMGETPESLAGSADNVHFSTRGYQLLGEAIRRYIQNKIL